MNRRTVHPDVRSHFCSCNFFCPMKVVDQIFNTFLAHLTLFRRVLQPLSFNPPVEGFFIGMKVTGPSGEGCGTRNSAKQSGGIKQPCHFVFEMFNQNANGSCSKGAILLLH